MKQRAACCSRQRSAPTGCSRTKNATAWSGRGHRGHGGRDVPRNREGVLRPAMAPRPGRRHAGRGEGLRRSLRALQPAALAPHLAALKSLAGALEEAAADEREDEIDRTALLNEIRV